MFPSNEQAESEHSAEAAAGIVIGHSVPDFEAAGYKLDRVDVSTPFGVVESLYHLTRPAAPFPRRYLLQKCPCERNTHCVWCKASFEDCPDCFLIRCLGFEPHPSLFAATERLCSFATAATRASSLRKSITKPICLR